MADRLKRLLDSFFAALHTLTGVETHEQRLSSKQQQVQQAIAILLYETARVDHDVKKEDLNVAEQCLRELFGLSPAQAQALITHAAQLHQRPTSYHPLTTLINNHLSAQDKRHLVEYMWRVVHADREVDMYEDHLVRKIAELLYVPHRDFINAKHRARS